MCTVLKAGVAMQAFSCTLSPFPSSSSASSSCSAAAAASPAASAAVASSFHSAEAAGRLPSAAAVATATTAAGPTAAATVKPFDRELFRAFISAASRLFCDDEQIVVIDFLAHHEKAFTERELSDRLRWGERRVREACAALERLMLVAKEHLLPSGNAAPRKADNYNDNGGFFAPQQQQDAHGGGGGGGQQQTGASAPSYYRVSPFCFLVFHYRLQRMEHHVESQRRIAESRDVFFCPACRTQYDALEAQLLDVHPQDAHFLCKFCNERLEHEDSKLLLQQAISLQERCEKQLQVLKTLVRRGWNMQIPTFPPFTRAEKNQQKLKSSEEEEKNKKGVLGLRGDNLNGHGEGSFLKQPQPGGILPDGSRTVARAQPSWIGGAPTRRRGEETAAVDASAAGTAGADGKSAISVYTEGGSGGWGQLVNNKAATATRQAEASGRVQQQSSVSSAPGAAATAPGGRNQIKFAMKNTGVGGKPGSVLGSRLRAAHAVQLTAGASSPVKTAGKAAAPAATCATTPAEAAESSAAAGTAGSAAAATGTGRRASGSSVTSPAQSAVDSADAVKGAAAVAPQQAPQQQQETREEGTDEKEQQQLDTAVPDTAATAAGLHKEELSATAVADIDGGAPLLYVSRMGREMTLEEAADYQQEMTAEEHEKFMELQAMYLDEI